MRACTTAVNIIGAEGRRVLARLVSMDGARRRLGLSLGRVRASEWTDWENRSVQQEGKQDEEAEGDFASTED